jgi:hypothetical protein
VRVYLPATSTLLHRLLADGEFGPPPLTAFAVTPLLREWYLDDDEEELEYAALRAAAVASLRLIDADPAALRRRVVVVAEVDDAAITVHDDLERGAVRVSLPVLLRDVASVHVDDTAAREIVAAAAASIIEADLGDEMAQERVDDAEGNELGWYATQELPSLLAESS